MYINMGAGGQDMTWGLALREAELNEEVRAWRKK